MLLVSLAITAVSARSRIRINGGALDSTAGSAPNTGSGTSMSAFNPVHIPNVQECGPSDLLAVDLSLHAAYDAMSSASEGFAPFQIEPDDAFEYTILWTENDTGITLDLEGPGWKLRDADVKDQYGCANTADCALWRPQESFATRRFPLKELAPKLITEVTLTAFSTQSRQLRALLKDVRFTRGGKLWKAVWGEHSRYMINPRFHWAGTASTSCHPSLKISADVECGSPMLPLDSVSTVPAVLHTSFGCRVSTTVSKVGAAVSDGVEYVRDSIAEEWSLKDRTTDGADSCDVDELCECPLDSASHAYVRRDAGSEGGDAPVALVHGIELHIGVGAEQRAGRGVHRLRPLHNFTHVAGNDSDATNGTLVVLRGAIGNLTGGNVSVSESRPVDFEVMVPQLAGQACSVGCEACTPEECCSSLATVLYANSSVFVSAVWSMLGGPVVHTELRRSPVVVSCPGAEHE